MTKQDYELIASVLRRCKPPEVDDEDFYDGLNQCWHDIINEFADELASKNPRFDPDKFMKAIDKPSK